MDNILIKFVAEAKPRVTGNTRGGRIRIQKLVTGWPGEPHLARTDLIWTKLNKGIKNQLYKNSG